MKAVMISIRPKWVAKIAIGEKTIDVRKSAPKMKTPFKCYIYCTKHHDAYDLLEWHDWDKGTIERMNCKVVGEFVCDEIKEIKVDNAIQAYFYNIHETCLTDTELRLYATKGKPLYGWHISNLKIYDKPKELSEFRKEKGNVLSRPFQSWGYVYD